MKLGVISDTHLLRPDREFRRLLDLHFKDVDKIVHAGDFVDPKIADYLSGMKDLIAVSGNMDPQSIQDLFPKRRTFTLGKFSFGLIHGGGAPFGIEARIREEFEGVDVIIYGHTHAPANHRAGGILFFNPGSPTRPLHGNGTLGLIKINDTLEGEIISI